MEKEHPMAPLPSCTVCGVTEVMRCAKCKTIYYCSSKHQHMDWPIHKQECRRLAKAKNNNKMQQLQQAVAAASLNNNLPQVAETPQQEHPLHNGNRQVAMADLDSDAAAGTSRQVPMLDEEGATGTSKQVAVVDEDAATGGSAQMAIIDEAAGFSTEVSAPTTLAAAAFMQQQSQSLIPNIYLEQQQQWQHQDYNAILRSQIHRDFDEEEMLPSFSGCQCNGHERPTTSTSAVQYLRSSVNAGLGRSTNGDFNPDMYFAQEPQMQQAQERAVLQEVPQMQQEQQGVPIQEQPQGQEQEQQPQNPHLNQQQTNQLEKSSSFRIQQSNVHSVGTINERRYEDLCRNIINDLNHYGLSVVDDFLGLEKGLDILNEVHRLYSTGIMQDGQLVNSYVSDQDLRTIRGDKITWVKGVEPGCLNVGYLVNQVDAVICRANTMHNNGILGNYNIKERTKAMVACYPGSGSHYVVHVDNPNKDGRVITAIYYLNVNWDSKRSGGVLRIFPEHGHTIADIEPKFDRLVIFWSDKRNPHEVQPSHRTRYAITVWYFDAFEREMALSRCKTNGKTDSDSKSSDDPDDPNTPKRPPTGTKQKTKNRTTSHRIGSASGARPKTSSMHKMANSNSNSHANANPNATANSSTNSANKNCT